MSAADHWDWARYALGLALILCNIGVWRGVALEESFVDWDRETGKILLIRSLALEALFAAMLFVVDTVGSLHQKAEIAQLEASNLQLEAQIQPRRLADKEIPEVGKKLSVFSGTHVKISSHKTDVEAALLGSQIMRALSLAHIELFDRRMTYDSFGSIGIGVLVSGSDTKLVAAIIAALPKRFDANEGERPGGFPTILPAGEDAVKTDATIFIGVKPLPP